MRSRDANRQSKPTEADAAAAKRLRAEWEEFQLRSAEAGKKVTQKVLIDAFSQRTGRGSQGLISQYLNGQTRLNYLALTTFCEVMGIDPLVVRADLPEQSATIDNASQPMRLDLETLMTALERAGAQGGKLTRSNISAAIRVAAGYVEPKKPEPRALTAKKEKAFEPQRGPDQDARRSSGASRKTAES